jgi:hypothetical protein
MAPAWIEADKTVRALLDERDRLLQRSPRLSALGRSAARHELRRIVEAANRAILRVNIEAPTDRQQRPLLDVAAEMRAFEAALSGEAPRRS